MGFLQKRGVAVSAQIRSNCVIQVITELRIIIATPSFKSQSKGQQFQSCFPPAVCLPFSMKLAKTSLWDLVVLNHAAVPP